METDREFPPGAFERDDESDDARFYAPPRLVTHIDDGAIAALGEFYGGVIAPGGSVLDLMSSWVSHLPDSLDLAEVIGHGMNEYELASNPRLSRWFVQNLNHNPSLAHRSRLRRGAVLCERSIPSETGRSLRRSAAHAQAGGAIHRQLLQPLLSDQGRGDLALARLARPCFANRDLMAQSGFSDIEAHVLANGMHGDPLVAVTGQA